MRILALAAALALAAMPAGAKDWNATSTVTQGGHLLGNPQAEKKLITFVSYSCPHCGTFEKQADAALRLGYVQNGKLSLEVRHVIRNVIDMTAVLMTECGNGDKFFGNHRAIFDKQEDWLAKASSTAPSQQQRWSTGALPSRLRAVAGDLDFYDILERRGYSRTQLDQCLSDEARAKAFVLQMQADNAKWDIPGTPSFALNGEMLPGVHSWPQLQQVLDSPAG